MQITTDRLALFNNDDEQRIFVIEDLVDAAGLPVGTRVTLKIQVSKDFNQAEILKNDSPGRRNS
jgi:hypothetical protein